MSFYEDWENCLLDKNNDFDYIEAFLKKKDFTRRVLRNGNIEQIKLACSILLNYDVDKIISVINNSFYSTLTPAQIIQFSNFENGTIKLAQLLYNKTNGMSYSEIGRKLVGSEEQNAATKYGENHSKLARDFDLVTISDHKPSVVKITNFGKFFVFFDYDEQIKLIRLFALRDPLIQNLIIKANNGVVYYSDECKCLSESTKIRRRGNVKKLLELVFEKSNNLIINNIIW